MSNSLEFTGERFVPELVREIRYEHWHRYAFAVPMAGGRRVLDCACGEGYGSDLLAGHARSVVGADLSGEAIAHARNRYAGRHDNLEFIEADCADLPFGDDSFDLVVCFETLEHVNGQAEMLDEFRRVLRTDGLLVLSSPDKRTYSDERGYENEFHVRELYRGELMELLGPRFPALRLYGQKLLFHSAIWSLDGGGVGLRQGTLGDDGEYRQATVPGHDPLYFIALCAAEDRFLPESGVAVDLFDDQSESVYEHYNAEIRHHIESGRVFEDMQARIRELERSEPRPLTARVKRWFDALMGRKHGK